MSYDTTGRCPTTRRADVLRQLQTSATDTRPRRPLRWRQMHDPIYKKLFGFPDMVRDLLRAVGPDWIDDVRPRHARAVVGRARRRSGPDPSRGRRVARALPRQPAPSPRRAGVPVHHRRPHGAAQHGVHDAALPWARPPQGTRPARALAAGRGGGALQRRCAVDRRARDARPDRRRAAGARGAVAPPAVAALAAA